MTTKAIVFDCEIKNAIPTKDEPLRPRIVYCKGWQDYLGMGIAVISVFDYFAQQYRIFCQDNLSDFAALVDDSELIIGFNNDGFDNKLVAAHGIEIDPGKSWDLLKKTKEASEAEKFAKGYKLDDFAMVNLRVRKKADGALAPILWQQGQIGKVIDYGLTDTWLTKRCIDIVIETGQIIDPRTGRRVELTIPLQL